MNTLKLSILGLLSMGSVVGAPEKVIMQLMQTKSQFDYYVEQYPAVVAYCYALPEHDQKKEEEIRRIYHILQKNMIKHAHEYDPSHVKFIAVNRSASDLIELQKEYGFKNDHAYLMFFKQGKAVVMKLLPQGISAQKIDALIAERQVEKFGAAEQVTREPRTAEQVQVEEEIAEENDGCYGCAEAGTERPYCSNRLCKFCRYKRPTSYYDAQSDFLIGVNHLYGETYSPMLGNYWGGTITNPIN